MTRSVVRRHLTVDSVADHLEGLLPDTAAAEAERHLSSCPDCAAIRVDLVAVREMLAAQSAEPMPDAVALRIETMLAEAWTDLSAGRAAVSDTRVDVSAADADLAAAEDSATTVDLAARTHGRPSRARRRRIIPVFAAAVGTIGVVFSAAVIGPELMGNSGDEDSAGSVTAGAPEGAREDLLEDGAGGMAEAQGEEGVAGLQAIPVGQSGRDYTSYTFAAGVADLLAAARAQPGGYEAPLSPDSARPPGSSFSPYSSQSPSAADGPAPSTFALAEPGQPLAPFADGGARLRACIGELAEQDVEPILVDLGTFAGEPAVVIVLPDDSDPASATAWAVDQRCGTGLPPEQTTFAVVTTPHPTAAPVPTQDPPVPTQDPGPGEPTSSITPHNPGTPPT